MDNFLKTTDGFEKTLKLIETINRSTDDYLFIWDIQADERWFFGDIDARYDIRKDGSNINSTPDMMRVIHPADRAAVLKSLNEIKEGKKDTHNMDYRWITREGEKVWINCHGTVIRDDKGQTNLMIGRVSEENLRHLYDPLTGLWNKIKLRLDLKERLDNGHGFLLYLDIDGLASINLARGRDYGDQLLKEIAELCENTEQAEMAYYVDHHYFAMVLNAESEDDVRAVYDAVKGAMAGKCTFTGSAVPIDKTLFYDASQLLDSMNLTHKKAKEISNNRLAFFSSEDLSEKLMSLALLEEFKQSVQNDCAGFSLLYQPQLRAGNYEIYGVEALLRYQSPTRGPVYPNEFIPVLEQSRLIKDVGMWVLREAARQCQKWRAVLPNLRVSVNFSVLQFEDVRLAERVTHTLQEIGLPSEALTIEITESMELHNSERLIRTMKTLKECHINFAIDDFGTGYSNLGYLKQLNVDEIKIDRVFVSGVEKDTYNHKLISNVIEFAKTNAIRTCCEGVESTHELVTLELLLPDLIQGFLFDKPITAEAIERTYLDSTTAEYQQRAAFVQKLYDFKEKMGVIHFDPKDILRENGVGLWMMRVRPEEQHYELHIDGTSEQVFGVDRKYTSTECYAYWGERIATDDIARVNESIQKMIKGGKAVQIEFLWNHSQLGDVMVRFSGRRVSDADGMIVLEGYHRIISDVADA